MMTRLASRLDLPEESMSAAPRITISGGGRVLIEGHRGLLEFAEERIAAAGEGCTILVRGENLQMRAMSGRDLIVTGRLRAVELV